MGGRGSGNHYRFGTKDTTAGYRRIDVRAWQREGRLVPGWFFWWSGGGSMRVEVHDLAAAIPQLPAGRELMLVLEYTHRRGEWGEPEDVRQPVFLDWTPCTYGGQRPWFRCSADGCSRRVALLCGAGKYFACRHCYQLVYESQREAWHDRALTKAQRIRLRLGGEASLLAPFPPKPPRMHWTTYERLWRAAMVAEGMYEVGVAAELAQLAGRLARYAQPTGEDA